MKKKLWLILLATASTMSLAFGLSACGKGNQSGGSTPAGEKLPEENFAEIWEKAFDREGEQFKNCKITSESSIEAPTQYGWTNRLSYTVTTIFADGLEYGVLTQKQAGLTYQREYYFNGTDYFSRQDDEDWENENGWPPYDLTQEEFFEESAELDPYQFEFDAQKGQYTWVDEVGQTITCKFKNEKIAEFSIGYKASDLHENVHENPETKVQVVWTFIYGGQNITLPAELS